MKDISVLPKQQSPMSTDTVSIAEAIFYVILHIKFIINRTVNDRIWLNDFSLERQEKEIFQVLGHWNGRCESEDLRSPGEWNVLLSTTSTTVSYKKKKHCYNPAPSACTRPQDGNISFGMQSN